MKKVFSALIGITLLSVGCFQLYSAKSEIVESSSRYIQKAYQAQSTEPTDLLEVTPSKVHQNLSLLPGMFPEKRRLFTAFWNSNDVPENGLKKLMSAGITRSPNFKDLERVVESGRKVIPLFGAFKAGHTEIELRQRIGWYTNGFKRIGWDNIECIILRDEPYLKDLTTHQMEVIIDEAKKQYEAPLAFTFTQNSINNRPLPSGLDVVILNFYPFFENDAPEGYAQIHDYQAFKQEFDKMVRLIRQKSPGSAIAITAQVFGSESKIPWRIPEANTAGWYMRAIAEYDDVVGLTFWGWESNRHTGLSKIPELQQAWIDAIQKWERN